MCTFFQDKINNLATKGLYRAPRVAKDIFFHLTTRPRDNNYFWRQMFDSTGYPMGIEHPVSLLECLDWEFIPESEAPEPLRHFYREQTLAQSQPSCTSPLANQGK